MKNIILFSFVCLFSVSVFTYAGEPDSVTGVKKESPVFQLSQNDLKISFGGRIQIDGALFHGADYQPIANGVGFRRVRFSANASFGQYLSGKIESDFAGGVYTLKDCYIKYDMLNGFVFRLGNFQEGFSMETMTASGDFLFLEVPNVVSALSPEYHLGFQTAYQKNNFLWMGGVHFQKISGSKEKDNTDASNVNGQNEGISYTARAVWMPRSEDNSKGFHLGLAASYRTPKTDMGATLPNAVRYNTTSLSGINKIKFLDTGSILSVNHDWLFGAELAGYNHGFRFQSEYIIDQTHRMGDLPTEKFNGCYAEAACLLFGGQQKYVTGKGAFTQPSLGKEWGDIELAARVDRLDLNGTSVKGGQANGYTMGVNYYMNKYLKLQLNYSYIDQDKYANAAGSANVGYTSAGVLTKVPASVDESRGKGGNDYGIISIRAQLNF